MMATANPELISQESNRWQSAIGALLTRIETTARDVGQAFPLYAEPTTGTWVTSSDGRWTGGFWVGLLWLAHRASGESKYRALAEDWLRRLEHRLEVDNVLNGLVFYYGASLGALLTGSKLAADLGRTAAQTIARRFDPRLGMIPLGLNSGSTTVDPAVETNVDGIPGMGLLFWASAESGSRDLRSVATEHVRRHLDLCLRVDGSFFQAAVVDPGSGAPVRRFTPRGINDDSTWARAQSWALLGLVIAHTWTSEPMFLTAACRAADWWLDHVPADRVAFWDFGDPAIPAALRDTSATAMAAAALLKLAERTGTPTQRERYASAGAETVHALVKHYLTPTVPGDNRPPGILTEGCWQRMQNLAERHELIWGTYFLLEALLRLTGRADGIA